jgi:hypothetical protein
MGLGDFEVLKRCNSTGWTDFTLNINLVGSMTSVKRLENKPFCTFEKAV